MTNERIQEILKDFVANYAKLNGVRSQLATPKYDHYVEGASDFADELLRRLASAVPAGPRCPRCKDSRIGILESRSKGCENVIFCPNCQGRWHCSGLLELTQFFSPSPATEGQPPEIGRLYCDLTSAISHLLGLIEAKGLEGWQIGFAKQVVRNVETQYFGYPVAAAVPAPESPQTQKTCTCPKTQWTGSEPNDSTCELSEEEHRALAAPESVAPPQYEEFKVPSIEPKGRK